MPHLSAEDLNFPTRPFYEMVTGEAPKGTWAFCPLTPKQGDGNNTGPSLERRGQGTAKPPNKGWKQELESCQKPAVRASVSILSPLPTVLRPLSHSLPVARWPFMSVSMCLLCPSPRLALEVMESKEPNVAAHSCQICIFMFQNNQQKIVTFLNPIPSSWEGEHHRSI